MAFKQCDKCGKWYEPKDDNALCEDCVNNQHHETYNLSSVLTNEQAVTIKKRNNFFGGLLLLVCCCLLLHISFIFCHNKKYGGSLCFFV